MASSTAKPLIVHILDQLNVGGMETVAVNLIERSRDRYCHYVVCLRDLGRLSARLQALGVTIVSLGKQPGKDIKAYVRLWRMLLVLHPDIVHTYNIGAIDTVLCARLAGVRHVIHAEHGRDAADPHGQNVKYRRLRRLLSPAINVFIAVSEDLAGWLAKDVGIPARKIQVIHNGIDTEKYCVDGREIATGTKGFVTPGGVTIGTVGRLDSVKGYDVLLHAFAQLRQSEAAIDPRLVIIGEGPERAALERRVHKLALTSRVWLTGERDDVPRLLQTLDVYVCSSIAEGIALTIIEAMASGLPVIATQVGGNSELVLPHETGYLVAASDPDALAQALAYCLTRPDLLHRQGRAGRERARTHFSVDTMTARYCALYDQLLGSAPEVAEAG